MNRKRLAFERSLYPLPGEFLESAARRELELFGLRDSDPFAPLRCLSHPEIYERDGSVATELALNLDWARTTTLYPAYACMGSEPSLEQCIPHEHWKVCTECLVEALDTYGVPYLHRVHVFPRVRVCHQHGSRLFDHCPVCAVAVTKHSFHEFERCASRYAHAVKFDIDAVEWEFSRFINELLYPVLIPRSPVQVFTVIYERLLAMGYGTNAVEDGACADVHLGQVYRDCNALLPQSLAEFEWLDGVISQKSLFALAFFVCRNTEQQSALLSDHKEGMKISAQLIDLIPRRKFSDTLRR